MKIPGTIKRTLATGLALLPFLLVQPAAATTTLEVAVPWGATEFHSINAGEFADRVREATDGEIDIQVRAGDELGVKATETVRAVADGVVPMADSALFLNASRGEALAVESLPFLVADYAELETLHKHFRPLWEAILERNGQKALYIVPWPNQMFFVKQELTSLDDMTGLKMRSLDRLTTDWINRLGMTPVQLTNPEILQSLGSGIVEGVPTSAGTAAAQQYWDFLDYGYVTNHLWASNAMTLSMQAWDALSADQQQAIEAIAAELEPRFWEVSRADHEKKVAVLEENGMTVAPMPPAIVDGMRDITQELWEEYTKRMGEDALKALAAYRDEVGS